MLLTAGRLYALAVDVRDVADVHDVAERKERRKDETFMSTAVSAELPSGVLTSFSSCHWYMHPDKLERIDLHVVLD